MTPLFHPQLVNGRFGDAALYVDYRFEKRALQFDLGDVHDIPPRKLLRLTDVFVSHAHIDHLIGFDHLLRVLIGRDKRLRLYGPEGFIDKIESKLGGYTWNLADRYADDLDITVVEASTLSEARAARFRLKNRFRREDSSELSIEAGLLRIEDSFCIRFVILDHEIPCLGFALEEVAHINIWKNRLDSLGLTAGPWLRDLKQAIRAGSPDDALIEIGGEGKTNGVRSLSLGRLKSEILTITPGQKIAYVTDVAFTRRNADRIIDLARESDVLFIEAVFAAEDTDLAAKRSHLTTTQAGSLAREASVRRVEPFHFSPRYQDRETQMVDEVERAFRARG